MMTEEGTESLNEATENTTDDNHGVVHAIAALTREVAELRVFMRGTCQALNSLVDILEAKLP